MQQQQEQTMANSICDENRHEYNALEKCTLGLEELCLPGTPQHWIQLVVAAVPAESRLLNTPQDSAAWSIVGDLSGSRLPDHQITD